MISSLNSAYSVCYSEGHIEGVLKISERHFAGRGNFKFTSQIVASCDRNLSSS